MRRVIRGFQSKLCSFSENQQETLHLILRSNHGSPAAVISQTETTFYVFCCSKLQQLFVIPPTHRDRIFHAVYNEKRRQQVQKKCRTESGAFEALR